MQRIVLSLVLAAVLVPATSARCADDEVFSGPQVGEPLLPFKVQGVLGDLADKQFDLIEQAGGKPVAIIFVHEVTRPSVGLTRLIMNYVAKRRPDGLQGGVVFLSEDATETSNWMRRASHALPGDVPVGISADGREGPGAYGLNRNVTLTVLVGKANKVTANFALVQPSVQADAPKIAKAIVDVLGGGDVPTLAQLGAQRYMPADQRTKKKRGEPARGGLDPELGGLVRALIQKTASPDEVKAAAEAVEAYLAKHPQSQAQVAAIARRIIDAGKLENYGTPAAQAYLTKWAKKYGDQPE